MSNLGLLKNENVTEEQNEIYTNLDDSQSRSDMKGSPHQRKQQMDNRPVNQNDSGLLKHDLFYFFHIHHFLNLTIIYYIGPYLCFR